MLQKSGEDSGVFSTILSAGEHTLEWKYAKDDSDEDGTDDATVSNIVIVQDGNDTILGDGTLTLTLNENITNVADFKQEHIDAREKYNTTAQANHWLKTIDTSSLNEGASKFIEEIKYFFFATSSLDGMTNINYKGTTGKSLIKVINSKKLIFADFDGNGILHSVGDIGSNPNVGMLIIDFEKDIRLKINGKAKIIDDKDVIVKYLDVFETYNIVRLIEVDIEYVIPNCSNNISVVRESLKLP